MGISFIPNDDKASKIFFPVFAFSQCGSAFMMIYLDLSFCPRGGVLTRVCLLCLLFPTKGSGEGEGGVLKGEGDLVKGCGWQPRKQSQTPTKGYLCLFRLLWILPQCAQCFANGVTKIMFSVISVCPQGHLLLFTLACSNLDFTPDMFKLVHYFGKRAVSIWLKCLLMLVKFVW